jgi:glutamine amidotransferase
MKIAIIKYNAGNIRSVDFAIRRLGFSPVITGDHEVIKHADKVIFPGVGEAGSTMKYLRENGLDVLIKDLQQPVFGICLGLQLLCTFSEEGNTECIGIFNETVKRFDAVDKIPHMGWNTIRKVQGRILSGDLNDQYVYFVHGYYVPVCKFTVAVTDYILPFSSALEKDNFFATQFHPEKSGSIGEKILKSFLEL